MQIIGLSHRGLRVEDVLGCLSISGRGRWLLYVGVLCHVAGFVLWSDYALDEMVADAGSYSLGELGDTCRPYRGRSWRSCCGGRHIGLASCLGIFQNSVV